MATSHSLPSRKPEGLRVGRLAVLPVFFNLNGRSVLVIGGGEPAAWKAELLAQAGANVLVIAKCVSEAVAGIATRTDLQGSVHVEMREWSQSDMNAKALVIADTEADDEARAIFDLARLAGVPVNVIDKSEFCTFQFGTIVNRSPVVIGISTNGAAPVLGQAIRTRIESLLPETLSQWADYAREIRSITLRCFKPGVERRKFWAYFASLAFGAFRPERIWSRYDYGSQNGIATTIRVNPLDPDELTLKSIRILQAADVIYFESCIAASVVDHARREAKRISVENCKCQEFASLYKAEIDNQIRGGQQVVIVRSNTPTHSVIAHKDEPAIANFESVPVHFNRFAGGL